MSETDIKVFAPSKNGVPILSVGVPVGIKIGKESQTANNLLIQCQDFLFHLYFIKYEKVNYFVFSFLMKRDIIIRRKIISHYQSF